MQATTYFPSRSMRIYLFTCIIWVASSNPVHAQDASYLSDSILKPNSIPEIAYAVVSPDSILSIEMAGFHRADATNDFTKASRTDYFHLGSNTKAITGFIAAYLVERNKINWETKFFDLFPQWKKQSNVAYYGITLKDLLSHRAGIEPYTSGLEFDELPEFKGSTSEQRKLFVRYLLREKPARPSGKTYAYSNAGYSIAALMLEKRTGKTWEQLVEEVLGDALHLHYFIGWPNKYNTNEPWGHLMENDTLKPLPPNYDYRLPLIEPAGDISMPLPDYARFIQLNLQGLEGKNNLLKSGTYQFLHYGLKDYSIGWGNGNTNNKQISEHAGSAGTFYCITLIDKIRKRGYIIMANSATQKAQQGILKLLEKLRKQ